MGRRKSLAEELAELANPAPTKEPDPDEVDALGGGAVLDDSDEDLGRPSTSRPSRRAPEAPRLRPVLDLGAEDLDLGVMYRGRKTTRAEAFGADGGGGGSSSEDEGGDRSEEEGDGELDMPLMNDLEEHGDLEGIEEEGEKEEGRRHRRPLANGNGIPGRPRHQRQAGSSEDDDDDSDDDDAPPDELPSGRGNAPDTNAASEDDEDDDGDGNGSGGDGDGAAADAAGEAAAAASLGELDAEYERMAAADDAAVGALQQRAERERAKGAAVAAQRSVWERVLEGRILLQRALQGGNRLPEADVHSSLVASSEPLATAFAGLRAAALDCLADMGDLRRALEGQHPAVEAAAAAAGKTAGAKRSREQLEQGGSDAVWQELTEWWEYSSPFRDASLDRWHRKTLLQQGGPALRGGLRALGQSVSQQVAVLMGDPSRLAKRARLPRSAAAKLCSEAQREYAARRAAAAAASAAAAADGDGTAAAGDAGFEEGGGEELDEETYDDGEFYSSLLQEFLEASGADARGALAASQARQRKRKQVDRKASKGRKLRYQVHEKLVGFVAPLPLDAPTFASQLFSNLFGKASGGTEVATA